ncbi:MAG: D-glycero-beta-D-manno-heptose-7-phosphate kinase [Nisaea sp.]|uniref:D-glycero-beta-D-manno-heptose-7-phosphate kinase n=1 Tax=Nisaea sp. TaxID=2024842 RepID=UPI001B0B15D6|nr:D-glycero-beta-D-manno-heptose-7-phosphate kinase [Nisaea sp.]MBO6562193.1 D-glycero-beta-D-manno-heptose-7-phosphate kinase [Nisaea sp.]
MTHDSDLAAKVDSLAGVRLLCVGDAMLDRFVYGTVDRISPEAPVPVLRIQRETAMLGGAGNVVRNLVALGAEACFISVIGRDAAGRELTGLVAEEAGVESHLLTIPGRETTIKVRYVAGAQQLLRADQENVDAIDAGVEEDLISRAVADMEQSSALVLSDYGKGLLSRGGLAKLIGAARQKGRPVIVDPKGSDYGRYTGATVITPNRRELSEASGMPVDSVEAIVAAARHIIETSGIESVLVTRSQDGMTYVSGDPKAEPLHFEAVAREVFDVSGAGDTVVAVLAAALGRGLPIADGIELANAAAGIVVGKMGTAVAYASELAAAFRAHDLLQGEVKVASADIIANRAKEWRAQGLRVGFTNGCFDLLHPGHVSLMRQAKAACDRLVVGLNSDASVARLKGPTRPVQSEASRAAVLASLATVDAVVIFGEDTPLELIKTVRPDVLVKGADYTVETVVGAEFVQSYGGKVVLAQLEDGHSTTATIARMNAGK